MASKENPRIAICGRLLDGIGYFPKLIEFIFLYLNLKIFEKVTHIDIVSSLKILDMTLLHIFITQQKRLGKCHFDIDLYQIIIMVRVLYFLF